LAHPSQRCSACEASRTECVEARGVMKPSRENVDWPCSVWTTRAEELLHQRSGWMQKKPSCSLSERSGEYFFLDIPSHRTHRTNTRLRHVNGTMLLLGPSPAASGIASSCRYRATGPLLAASDSTSGRPPGSSPAPPPPSLERFRSLEPGPVRLELPPPQSVALPIRCSRDQLAGLGQALNAFRVMPNHNLFDNSLNDLHERLRQSAAATPAIGSIIPLDEFATAATNLFPFLAHKCHLSS
jgi:hypothetical protein